MKIIFLTTAYVAIGFSSHYTGKFIKNDNTYIENENGHEMTIKLPEHWVTVGKILTESEY